MLRQYYASTLEHGLLSQPGILAAISHQFPCRAETQSSTIPIGLHSLNNRRYEIIQYADQVAQRGMDNGCCWSRIDDVMCAATWLTPEECNDIKSATAKAYERLLQHIAGAGFMFPFRIWNFLPNINEGDGDSEQYKQFCLGRKQAFVRSAFQSEQFPAASALGHRSEGAVIYLLASTTPAQHFENPRQQPAYRYPRRYGPASPSFARASCPQLRHGSPILISGTASILGHDTQAAGNLKQQLELTWSNILHLQQSIDSQATDFGAVRVYLRNEEDLAFARNFLLQYVDEEKLNFVHADICRANLLVEIEAAACIP